MEFLNGHTRYGDFRNGSDEQCRQEFFRLNTELPFPIRRYRKSIYICSRKAALLVSNFYFQVGAFPIYDRGFYFCEGSIRCRGDYKYIDNALYQPETSLLLRDPSPRWIYEVVECAPFIKKRVSFYVRHPIEAGTISLRLAKGTERKISGFHKNIQLFETQ